MEGTQLRGVSTMGKIVLVGKNDWTRFAHNVLRAKGVSTVRRSEQNPGKVSAQDLVVLSAGPEGSPSSKMGDLFRKLGPLRILVMDARDDFRRAGDAARAHAVGYEPQSWDRDKLLEIIAQYEGAKPPDEGAIERRFGP